MEITQINWQSDSLGVIRAKQELSKFLEDQPQKGKYPKIDAYNEKRIKDLTSYIQQNHTMQITTTTIQGKTGLEIEALIREAYESGERNFTTDLPTDIFDPSSIGSTQIDADGTPYTDWGFNVGEWDLVADTETLGEVPARVNEKREVITMEEHWVRGFEQGQHTNHAQDSFYNFVKYSGLSIKKLTANTWQDQDPKTLTLPFRFVRLFDLIDGEMTLTAIGIF